MLIFLWLKASSDLGNRPQTTKFFRLSEKQTQWPVLSNVFCALVQLSVDVVVEVQPVAVVWGKEPKKKNCSRCSFILCWSPLEVFIFSTVVADWASNQGPPLQLFVISFLNTDWNASLSCAFYTITMHCGKCQSRTKILLFFVGVHIHAYLSCLNQNCATFWLPNMLLALPSRSCYSSSLGLR